MLDHFLELYPGTSLDAAISFDEHTIVALINTRVTRVNNQQQTVEDYTRFGGTLNSNGRVSFPDTTSLQEYQAYLIESGKAEL